MSTRGYRLWSDVLPHDIGGGNLDVRATCVEFVDRQALAIGASDGVANAGEFHRQWEMQEISEIGL